MKKLLFFLVLCFLIQFVFLSPAQAEKSIFDEGYLAYVNQQIATDPNFVKTLEFKKVVDELYIVTQLLETRVKILNILTDCNQTISEMEAAFELPLPVIDLEEHQKFINDFFNSRE
ncbi:MAG: hypothetical protein V1770_04625 [bacterium]